MQPTLFSRRLFLSAPVIAWMAGCTVVVGNGQTEVEERRPPPFVGVQNETMFDVDVRSSATVAVQVSCDSNLLHRIDTFVEEDRLHISVPFGTHLRPKAPCLVSVSGPRFEDLTNVGSGDMTAHGTFDHLVVAAAAGSGNLSIESIQSFRVTATNSGSGNLWIDALDAVETDVTSTGSGMMRFAGVTLALNAAATGSGSVRLRALTAREATITNTGSGPVFATVSDWVDVTLSGSGDVEIWGTPSGRETNDDGSGSIRFH